MPEAVAAVEIALHDLAAKASNRPVWAVLGADEAKSVVCNATLPAANPTATRAIAESWSAEGFRTFKLKVGLPGDVTQVATVRETLGPEVAIRVDANGAWSVGGAAERLGALARHGIELAEQPVGTLEQMAELRKRVRIRFAADESLVAPRDARRALELEACELAAIKIAKVGGIGAALEIAETLPAYLSSALEAGGDHRRGARGPSASLARWRCRGRARPSDRAALLRHDRARGGSRWRPAQVARLPGPRGRDRRGGAGRSRPLKPRLAQPGAQEAS